MNIPVKDVDAPKKVVLVRRSTRVCSSCGEEIVPGENFQTIGNECHHDDCLVLFSRDDCELHQLIIG